MSELKKLFKPAVIGKMKLKNRFVMAPLNNHLSDLGLVSDRLIKFLERRAQGGVGLIIMEATCVDWPRGKAGIAPPRIDDWKYVPRLGELVEIVHQYNTKIAVQLHHAGRQQSLVCSEDEEIIAPSPIPCTATGAVMPHELTIDEIEEIQDMFLEAAQRAKYAGFDAVELHGAHGYLINQFISPYSNKRTDEYGGDFEGRMTFAVELVEGIKNALGNDYPIIFRLSGDEFIEGGFTIEDAKQISQNLEEVGVDALDITAGIYESEPSWWARIFPTPAFPKGCNVPLGESIKKVVNIPIIIVGRLGDPIDAEKVIAEGKADFVAIGRALLADPDIPKKAYEGRLVDIRPCIYCNEGCYGSIQNFNAIRCDVNAEVGKEMQIKIEPAKELKKILVVGAGPAGMEAARVAKLRGHEVILCEKGDKLGGQLISASIPWFKEPLRDLIKWFEGQLKKLGVKIKLNKEITKTIKEYEPDCLILATGAIPIIPDIQGVNMGHVVLAIDVITGKANIGNKIAIIGGGQVGCETAWFLTNQKKEVTLIETLPAIAEEMNMVHRFYITNKLKELGVELITTASAKEIKKKSLIIDRYGKTQTIEVDNVVLAAGFKPNKLALTANEVYEIGDCVKPRNIRGAIHDANNIAIII
ncbi:MAG: FAD-dependent oxidoreductase [Candidatus Helarchaeota archaeon]|nr:FAD-dependent oxidoreductase [Candidatus Helarchaeota archaeon]